METNHNLILEQIGKKPIVADLRLSSSQENAPVVIFCHGYKGFKDWGDMNLVASEIANNDLNLLKFNFSHNGGTVDQIEDFPDLEAFANNNFSIEQDDLKRIIDWVCKEDNNFKSYFNLNQIYVLGYSRGGATAIIYSSTDNRVKKLVTWSTVGALERRFPSGSKLDKWKKEGVMYIENSRTKQKMPHYFQFYEDFIKHRFEFSVSEAEKKLKISHLLIHGTKDETVYLGEAIHLMSLNERTSLIKLHEATHTFGAFHPYTSNELPKDTALAVKYTIAFFKNQ